MKWPVEPAGLTFSLGVSLFSGFFAIPRKFRKISKVECGEVVLLVLEEWLTHRIDGSWAFKNRDPFLRWGILY